MGRVEDLRIKLFADGADKAGMLEMHANPLIKGFTTNPTLMRKAGVADYMAFAKDICSAIREKPLSLEVFADEFDEMERQAFKLAPLGANVYVKIPVTNTRGESAAALIGKLSSQGVKLNVTALMTPGQTRTVVDALAKGPAIVSVFAGRVADTGRDPVPLMKECLAITRSKPGVELLWASPRELLNIFQADDAGVDIITATNDILAKLSNVGKDLHEYSLDTVKMFRGDALKAGYTL